jgi:hypothetical protein
MRTSERAPVRDSYAGLLDRDYFHIMLNLDSHPGFLPTARALADRFLQRARECQTDPRLEPQLRPFRYTPEDFEVRMDQIHRGKVEDVNHYEPQRSWTMRTREDVIEWIRQMAPLNQIDGSWLRHIAPVGPFDEVRSLLFTIWVDEVGGGNPQLNHANIYTELLRSVGIFLPDVRSREYADNPDMLDSAYTLPMFQLVVSQFPQVYLPELLGMTLYQQCCAVELKSMVRLAEYFGLDPHFYELHVAIDDPATGHRAMASRAVQLYLEQTRIERGEHGVQSEWARIWDGLVAFATTGTLAEDMRRRRLHPATPADRVAAIIRERAPKARLNHGRKRLNGRLINDLFADPNELMTALLEAGMVRPGDPDGSPFFKLLEPDGPMYKIFTGAEITTWREWVRSLPGQPIEDADRPGQPELDSDQQDGFRPLSLLTPPERVAAHPTGRIHGVGSVH